MYTDLNANDATGQPCDYPGCDRTDTTPVADHSGPRYAGPGNHRQVGVWRRYVPRCPKHAA